MNCTSFFLSAFSFVTLIVCCLSHGGDMNERIDRGHVKQHLDEVADMDDKEMTEQEIQFHYFKLHDYDNNNKLDGIELSYAVSHYHATEDEEKGEHHEAPRLADSEIMMVVDKIMEEEDHNGDGYVDYAEFAAAQKPDETLVVH